MCEGTETHPLILDRLELVADVLLLNSQRVDLLLYPDQPLLRLVKLLLALPLQRIVDYARQSAFAHIQL